MKKKATIFIILIGVLVVAVLGIKKGSAQEFCSVSKYESAQCNCGPITEGLRFCVAISLSKPTGKASFDFVVNDSLKNVSDKPIKISMVGDFSTFYTVTILDPSGNILLSKREIAAKNSAERNDNTISDLPVISLRGPIEQELAPQQELKSEFKLNQYYDFESKGKYQIEISRKIPKQDKSGMANVSYGTIVVEVK